MEGEKSNCRASCGGSIRGSILYVWQTHENYHQTWSDSENCSVGNGETSKKRFVYLGNQERIPMGPLGTSCYSLSREITDQARCLFLESPENFSGPKSQLPNCKPLALKCWCFYMFLMYEKPRGFRNLEPRRCEDMTGIGPKKVRDFWETGPKRTFKACDAVQ